MARDCKIIYMCACLPAYFSRERPSTFNRLGSMIFQGLRALPVIRGRPRFGSSLS